MDCRQGIHYSAWQEKSSMERRHAAIVVADVVGYSRLIRTDEDGTPATLKGLQAAPSAQQPIFAR
jgi:class 3 adenylate cyclase